MANSLNVCHHTGSWVSRNIQNALPLNCRCFIMNRFINCQLQKVHNCYRRYISHQGHCEVTLARRVVVSRKSWDTALKVHWVFLWTPIRREKGGYLFSSLCRYTWTSYRTMIRVGRLLLMSVSSKNLGHLHFGRPPPLSYWLFCALSCGMFSLSGQDIPLWR